jgi:aryl-alcohol dehydrogenase-like predicted oxidoreductase
VRELTKIAEELNTSTAKLAIAWCVKNPHVSTVITGASRASQVKENMKALDVVPQLTDDVIEKIEAVLDNKPEPMDFQ